MKIVQIVTSLMYGDAIGNDVLALHQMLLDAGYDGVIMAMTIDARLQDRGIPLDFSRLEPEDLAIFHKATGDPFCGYAKRLQCRKAVIYHNITPAKYFMAYDPVMAWNLWRGRNQLKQLAKCVDWGWGDSRYNCEELVAAGFSPDRVDVLPIPFAPTRAADGERAAGGERAARRRGEGTNLLFIGRVASNKKQEDIIKVFYCYLRDVDPKARLVLVGSWTGFEKYYAKLKGFAADLGLTEAQVVFTGHVTDERKQAYLSNADAFVCMSEHEGFCVPLLEAMDRDIPVAAYAAAAVPETLGDNGLLFREKDFSRIAREIGRVLEDEALRAEVLRKQRESLRRFDREATRRKFLELVGRATQKGADPS